MGSKSDLPVMQDAIDILKEFNIEVEVDIASLFSQPDQSAVTCKLFAKRIHFQVSGIRPLKTVGMSQLLMKDGSGRSLQLAGNGLGLDEIISLIPVVEKVDSPADGGPREKLIHRGIG